MKCHELTKEDICIKKRKKIFSALYDFLWSLRKINAVYGGITKLYANNSIG